RRADSVVDEGSLSLSEALAKRLKRLIARLEDLPQFPSASPLEQPSRISSSCVLRTRSGSPASDAGGVVEDSGSAAITAEGAVVGAGGSVDRKSTRLNSSHQIISYAG